jgi:hypothetical protein
MNLLTKFLLEDILEADKKKITAIYGGGFKPPTKGHFDVVAKAAEQNPEIDEFIIYVGGGVRDGIAQAESIMIWEIYKKYLPLKVRIEPVKTPVGDILRYAKEHPEEEVLWVIGARENNPEDFADIASRTRTLDKYPNLELRLIQTAGGVSGTAARKAVRDNNKEQFFHLIPNIEEKDQVWDIVSPIVTEGILDKTKELISNFQSAYKNQKGDFEGFKDLFKKYILKQELTPEEKEKLNRNVIDIFKMSTIPILGISGTTLLGTLTNFLSKGKFSTFPSKFKDKLLSINEVGEANLEPYKWEEVDSGRTTSVEFITPSETKYEVDLMHTEIDDPEDEDMSLEALDIEFLAKPKGAEGSSSKIVVNKGELYRVMSTIVDVIKHYLRKYRGDITAIIYSPSKKSSEENFGNQRDNLYRAFILKAFPDAKIEQQGENIITYLPDNTIVTEYNNTGPSTPKVYIVKADENYKEVPIEILSKIPNLTYDMGGGETNFYSEKNIVIVDNIPVEQFSQEPGNIKDEKIYVEYNLNQPYSFPKANKIIASQIVYHLGDIKSFAKTINDSLKNGGTFQFFSDLMNKQDKEFLNYLSSEYEFGLPKNLNSYKSGNLLLKKGDYIEPVISHIYSVTDANGNTAKMSVTKEGRWWKYDKIEGDIDFKPSKWSVEPEYKYNDITPSKENVLDTFSRALETDIVDFKKLNENLNAIVTEADPKKGTGKKPKGSGRRLYTDEDPSDTVKVKFKTKEDIVDTLNKESFKSKSHARQSQVINLIHQRVRAAYGKAKDPEVKSRLKRALDYIEKRKEMSKKKTERLRKLKEEITKSDLNQIERIADEWFEDYGIDVTFTHHFLDRVNDPRNGKPISPEELEDIFTQSAEKYGVKLSQFPDNFEAVLLKLRNDINVPFALNYDEKNDEIDLVAKTIMRKKDFKTSNPKLTLEKITNTEIICDNCGWTWKIKDGGNDLYICHKCGHDNSPKQLNENSIPSIDIKDKIDQINKYMIDKGHNMQPLPSVEFIEDDQENAENFLGKTAYYDPNNKKIVLYTFGRHPKDICRSYTHEMIHHIQNLENRLGNVTTTNTLEDDNINKLEQEANLKGTMTFRNWTDSLQEKKNKDPFGINAYALELARDLEESLNKEENVNKIWKTNQKSLPLPTLESKYKLKQVMKEEETPQQYEIYCDMDGVLVDFDKGYKNLTGQETHHVDLQGKDEFWGTFRQSLEDKKMQEKDYWANLEWMPDGKELWDHIQSMKPTLLSAPSRDPQSRWGKRIWVKKNIPGTPLILAAASAKKNYANKNSILIDDRISNINEWNAAGGIGILHTSTSSTIEKLSKYGL